jgi:ferredoxin
MLTAEQIKKCAKANGADIVGIGSTDRFEGAPPQMDPRYMFPDAKSVIVMGFRHFRGVFRGIEEGTFFTAYSAMGYAGINYIYQPLVLWNVSKIIEDAGYEALPLPNVYLGINTDASSPNLGESGKMNPKVSAPVEKSKPAPDVFIHIRIAAFIAGLGEIGFSKMFLSPELGPRQRLAAILTDAPLQADPLYEGKLCDKCMGCVKACSLQAIPRDKIVKIKVAGRDIEWADIDMRKCCNGFSGGSECANPFMITEEDKQKFSDTWASFHHKVKPVYYYARALEGASGCIRACMIHLEQQGKIKNLFKEPFRKRKPWRLQPI